MDTEVKRAARLATYVAIPVALLAGLGAFALFGGFDSPEKPRPQATGPVTMTAIKLTDRQKTVCLAFTSQLPPAIRELNGRPVTAGPEQNAAYGDPPITVACGGPQPTVELTDDVISLDATCWHERDDAVATIWTTIGREVPVTVTVPRAYDAPGQWVIEFSAPVAGSILSVLGQLPSGCKEPVTGR